MKKKRKSQNTCKKGIYRKETFLWQAQIEIHQSPYSSILYITLSYLTQHISPVRIQSYPNSLYLTLYLPISPQFTLYNTISTFFTVSHITLPYLALSHPITHYLSLEHSISPFDNPSYPVSHYSTLIHPI